ncbi:MAG TPA: hypothetical protein VH188_07190 [Chthoniobacterales bacterium]|nr:hypothetical protein [Chthoniobacterales bacterium]
MSRLSHPGAIVGLLVSAAFAGAALRSSNNPSNQDLPPETKEESGIVRVWNAKGEPPLERDHTPEAQLGDAIVVEVKNLDLWFCENLEAGAWADADAVKNADPEMMELIKDRQLSAALSVGGQLNRLVTADNDFDERKPLPTSAADWAAFVAKPDFAEMVGYVDWGGYEPKDEKGVSLDLSNSSQLAAVLERCSKALQFVRDFEEQESAKFILAINDVPLQGLVVERPASEIGWRFDNRYDLELKRANYTWFQFRLQGARNSDFAKAWSHLMQSAGTRFSNPSKVALSLPGEKKPLPTNITPAAEDLRCRFDLLALAEPTATPSPKHFKKGDAVYPLDERDLEGHVLKAKIVEEPDPTSETPYLVHFEERGGTRRYAGTELARLPPDLVSSGVVRVWNGGDDQLTDWENAQIDDTPQARIGDTVVVEVRNFGKWLARQVDNGFFQDEPLVVKASQASKALDEFIKAKRFSEVARVGRSIQRIVEGAPNSKAPDIVEKLQRLSKNDSALAALQFPKLTSERSQLPAPSESPVTPPSTLPTPQPTLKKQGATATKDLAAQREASKIKEEQEAQAFLAPFQAAESLLTELRAAKLRTLVLTINDIPLGITPENSDYAPVPKARRPAGDPKDDTYFWLHFSLRPKQPAAVTDEERKAVEDPFKRLMAHPSFTMPSKVALTLKAGGDTLVLPTAVTKDATDARARFALIGIETFKFWPMVFVFILILGSLGFFAASTDILRDPGRRRPEGVEPVSLAKTQMAFWFVVIAAAFAFLWVTTGNIDTINGTCLTLLAIGTTTALTTLAVQGNRSGEKDLSDVLQKTPHEMLKMRPSEALDEIRARKAELEKNANAMTPAELTEAIAILNRQEQEIDRFLKRRPKWCPRRVYYWRYRLRTVFEDLLTEQAATYDFHRFQMLAWTLVLGAVFVAKVFTERAMPQFDSNLLLLMGISSGAYIGFKMANPNKNDGPKDEEKPNTPKTA